MVSNVTDLGDVPPIHRIDLSLPPSERYVQLAQIYREQLRSLPDIFDEFLLVLPDKSRVLAKGAARLLLRKLYSDEETEEIKGISKVTGVDLYLLVALNVVMDSMACTSGAALSQQGNDSQAKMLHFRTLDVGGVDPLRKLVVQLEFVRSPETDRVLATSITYVGFVGVLTGVREGLSISLNLRPKHDKSSPLRNCRFYANDLLVLLGARQSISSLLRQYLLPPAPQEPSGSASSRLFKGKTSKAKANPNAHAHAASLDTISATLPTIPTTAAYLIFCDASRTLLVEKDYRTAATFTSSSFIVATNCDAETTPRPSDDMSGSSHRDVGVATKGATPNVMEGLFGDSIRRRERMQGFWNEKEKEKEKAIAKRESQTASQQSSTRGVKRNPESATNPTDKNESTSSGRNRCCSNTPDTHKASQQQSRSSGKAKEQENGSGEETTMATAALSEIVQWTSTYPITNELTHFATIMDPLEGRIAWIRRYPHLLRVRRRRIG